MLLPIDDPPDQLYGLITHELTHQFEFDIIPTSADPPQRAAVGERRAVGLRARAVELERPDAGPRCRRRRHRPEDVARWKATATPATSLLVYNLGHAVFEFIEAKFGKEGMRQFLFSLRKSVIGGGEDAYEEALRMKKDEFDRGVRPLPEGPLQAVPRQGTAGRLRARSVAEQGEDALRRSALHRPVAVGRSDCGRHRSTGRTARSTSSWCRRRTARSSAT